MESTPQSSPGQPVVVGPRYKMPTRWTLFWRSNTATRLIAVCAAYYIMFTGAWVLGHNAIRIFNAASRPACEDTELAFMGKDEHGQDRKLPTDGVETKQKLADFATAPDIDPRTAVETPRDSTFEGVMLSTAKHRIGANAVALGDAIDRSAAPHALMIEQDDIFFNEYGDVMWSGRVIAEFDGDTFMPVANGRRMIVQSNWRAGIIECTDRGFFNKMFGPKYDWFGIQNRNSYDPPLGADAPKPERQTLSIPVLPDGSVSAFGRQEDRSKKGNAWRNNVPEQNPMAMIVVPQWTDYQGGGELIIPGAQWEVTVGDDQGVIVTEKNGSRSVNVSALATRAHLTKFEQFWVNGNGETARTQHPNLWVQENASSIPAMSTEIAGRFESWHFKNAEKNRFNDRLAFRGTVEIREDGETVIRHFGKSAINNRPTTTTQSPTPGTSRTATPRPGRNAVNGRSPIAGAIARQAPLPQSTRRQAAQTQQIAPVLASPGLGIDR